MYPVFFLSSSTIRNYFFIKERIHKNTTAPTVAVIKLPIRLEPVPMPNTSKSHPPIRLPTMPTIKLITKPKPPPLTNLPPRKPATKPIRINKKKFIPSTFKRLLQNDNRKTETLIIVALKNEIHSIRLYRDQYISYPV